MKVAVVTGAGRRIGAAIARDLHVHGWHIVIHCNRSTAEAGSLAADLNAERADSARVISADLGEASALTDFTSECIAAWGQVDLLVNNASRFTATPLDRVSAETFDALMATNTRAPLLLSTLLADAMKGGSIINIIDIHGERPLPGYSIYSMSKAAQAMMTRALAVELAPDIRVNGVAPGAILWPEDSSEMSESEKRQLLADIPLGRLGSESDIAAAVRFLAVDAPFITGQILSADGGQSV